MDKILRGGAVFSGLLGLSVSLYGIYNISGALNLKSTDKVERYYRTEQITNTLDKVLKQADDINFGLDDLKMRETLSEAYRISNQQFNRLAEDKEVREYLSVKAKEYANAKDILIVGIGLLGLAFMGAVSLTMYNRTKENSIQKTKLDSYQN